MNRIARTLGWMAAPAFLLAATAVALFLAYQGWLYVQSLTLDDQQIRASEVYRNTGLVVVACLGVAFALWRSFQTEKQINQIQQQLRNDAVKTDRDNFTEAVKLASSETPQQRSAGYSILFNIARRDDNGFQREARLFLQTIDDNRSKISGAQPDEAEFWANVYVATNRTMLTCKTIENANIGIPAHSTLSVSACAVLTADFTTIRTDRSYQSAVFIENYIHYIRINEYDDVFFHGCVIDDAKISIFSSRNAFGPTVSFTNCRFRGDVEVNSGSVSIDECWTIDGDKTELRLIGYPAGDGPRDRTATNNLKTIPHRNTEFGEINDSVVLRRIPTEEADD